MGIIVMNISSFFDINFRCPEPLQWGDISVSDVVHSKGESNVFALKISLTISSPNFRDEYLH